jgi:hypothetical protein
MTKTADVEQLRAEMARIRRDLNGNVDGIVESAKELTDWRLFVRSYPWASVGAAVATGYLVAPRIFRDRSDHSNGESNRAEAVGPPARSTGKPTNPLLSMATSALMRNAAQLATHFVTTRLVSQPQASRQQPLTPQGAEYGHQQMCGH